MKSRVLMIACVPSMIGQFNMNNIQIIQDLGYEVDVACDFTDRSVWTEERIARFKIQLESMNVVYYQIDFSRSVLSFGKYCKSYHQLKRLCIEGKYEFIHCHTPIASAITRLVCKTINMKVIYTAHGFHFFKGAPLKNWILFYPIEKWLSRYTDILITINKEDYQRAKERFHMKCIEYVPGVGINIQKFKLKDFDREAYRRTLGLSNEDRMLLSIGELNENKNHQIVIKALGESKRNNIHFFIAGEGNQKDKLMELAKKNNIEINVHLLGHRNDINKLLHCADIFIHPSIREGLPVALMEAMVCEVPCIVSNIRGNVDLIDKNGGFKFAPNDVEKLIEYINILVSSKESGNEFIIYNRKKIKEYSMDKVNKLMNDIYHAIY